MRLSDFESMVRRLSQEVPAHFFEGISEVTVSPRAAPHPTRPEIYTLGECVPLPGDPGESVAEVRSRIVLYHGSFLALARSEPGFDWRGEAWETLTHELRHHLEWRARTPDLEAFDRAVESNYARQEGEPFDPLFHLDGEQLEQGLYRVEDDCFLDCVVRRLPEVAEFTWRHQPHRVRVPAGASLPCLLTLTGLPEPPEGEVVLVLRRRPRLGDLFTRRPAYRATAPVEPAARE